MADADAPLPRAPDPADEVAEVAPGGPAPQPGPVPHPDPASQPDLVPEPDPVSRLGSAGAGEPASERSTAGGAAHGADRETGASPTSAPPAAGPSTAAPPAGPWGGFRSALSQMTTRMVAERALRAAEAAEEDSRRAAQAAADAAQEQRDNREQQRLGPFAPFRIGLLGGLGLLLAYTLYLSLDNIRSTLIVIAIAALLAIGLDPAVGLLMRRGLSRGLAVAIVFMALLVFIAGAMYAIVPPVVNQIASAISSLPEFIDRLQRNPTIQNLDAKFGIIKALQNSDFIKNIGSDAAGGIVTVGFTVAGIAVDLLITLILALYFLAGLPRIKASAYRLAPASRRPRVIQIGDKIIKQMGGYLGGATLIALQAGIVAGVFSWIVGLPFPWAIGLAAALLDYVPVVGPIIIGIGMTLLGFTQSLIIGIIAGAFYVCQHLFEAYWLYPRVMRRTVDISTAAVIVAIVVGGALLGVTGAILAVPFAAAVQLIVREVVVPMQERS